MFRLQPNPTFWAKVAVTVPGDAKPGTIELEFRHKSREALKAFFDTLAGGQRSEAEALGELIVAWKGIDAEYSPESLAQLVDNYPASFSEIFEAYRRELMEGRRKN